MPQSRRTLQLIVVCLFVSGLIAYSVRDDILNRFEAWLGRRPLLGVVTWHYQLDRIEESLELLALNTSDMLVIDHAKRSGKLALTRPEVERLKVRLDGSRRLVIAYLSIGEAEEFRTYWDERWKADPPVWLGEENCAWPSAYRVQFWHDGWKNIIFQGGNSFLQRIIDAGFDGVYLDRVDIYEGFLVAHPKAREEMVAFVHDLAAVARRLRPGFIVIAQNAEDLLSDRNYRRAIDGIAKESLLHGASATAKRNKAEDISWSLSRLRLMLDDRKAVFAVEYLINYPQIVRVRRELNALGFVPTFPTRSLDGEESTLARDIASEVGTPERTSGVCPAGTAW